MSVEQLNIFLADDDVDDCNFFKRALTGMDTNITIANNGEELMYLLTLTTTKLPHILFLDLNMPRKNGFECLAEIRRNKNLLSLPVIVFSTSFEKEVVHQLHTAGAQYFIRKPSEYELFVSIIIQALELIKKKGSMQPLLNDFVIQNPV